MKYFLSVVLGLFVTCQCVAEPKLKFQDRTFYSFGKFSGTNTVGRLVADEICRLELSDGEDVVETELAQLNYLRHCLDIIDEEWAKTVREQEIVRYHLYCMRATGLGLGVVEEGLSNLLQDEGCWFSIDDLRGLSRAECLSEVKKCNDEIYNLTQQVLVRINEALEADGVLSSELQPLLEKRDSALKFIGEFKATDGRNVFEILSSTESYFDSVLRADEMSASDRELYKSIGAGNKDLWIEAWQGLRRETLAIEELYRQLILSDVGSYQKDLEDLHSLYVRTARIKAWSQCLEKTATHQHSSECSHATEGQKGSEKGVTH